MTTGRRPQPTHLKLLRGNPGKRALPKDEPKPEAGATMPDWLSPDAAKHWPIVARQLEDAGVLTTMDEMALALYCESFARYRYATSHVAKYGPVVKGRHGFPVQSPFVRVANDAWAQMARMLVEFGMTPAARTRVTSTPKQTSNAFDEFRSA